MTQLICNFADVLGRAVNGSVTISSGQARPGHASTAVILPEQREAVVTNGSVTFNDVNPGKIVLSVDWEGQSITFRTIVPDVPSITLSECLDTSFHPPSEVESLKRMIEAVRGLQSAFTELKSQAERAAQNAAASSAEVPELARSEVTEQTAELVSRLEGMASQLEQAKQATREAGTEAAKQYLDGLFDGLPEAFDTMQEIVDELEANQSARAALTSSLEGKAAKDHKHTMDDVTSKTNTITDTTPKGYALVTGSTGNFNVHTASITNDFNVANKQYVDNAKTELASQISGKADASHRHEASDIDGLSEAVTGKADADHKHSMEDITSGTVPIIMPTTPKGSALVTGSAGNFNVHPSSITSAWNVVNRDYVDARTPNVKVVASLPSSPDPQTVYIVTG